MPQIKITYDYTNTAKPWNVQPDHQPVPQNNAAEIKWTLEGANLPSGGSVQFDPTQGIVFPASKNSTPWPGETPTKKSDTEYKAKDDNTPGQEGTYKYTINIIFTNGLGQQQNLSHDPDIDNQGTILHLPTAVAV